MKKSKKLAVLGLAVMLGTTAVMTQTPDRVWAEDSAVPYAADITINETTFPDAEFRAYILGKYSNLGISKSEGDTLTEAELAQITDMDIPENVSDLTGVQYFTAIKQLRCPNTKITSLDMSGSQNLEWVSCNDTLLTSLNVSNCPNLKTVWCWDTPLTSLNTGNCPNLKSLLCSGTKITSLDVSGNANLETLWCEGTLLTSLNVGNCPKLKDLLCGGTKITSLDVSRNTDLETLWCSGTKITSLDLSNNLNLKELWCSSTLLTSLDVSRNVNLTELQCNAAKLTSLDVSRNVNLTELNCKNLDMAWLNIGNNPNLTNLNYTEEYEKEITVNRTEVKLTEKVHPDMDAARIIDGSVENGTLDKTTGIITVSDMTQPVVYRYLCGTAASGDIIVKVTLKLNGNVNGLQDSSIKITGNLNKTFDGISTAAPNVEKTGSTGAVSFKWEEETENSFKTLNAAPVDAGKYRVTAYLASDGVYREAVSEPVTFTIGKAAPDYTNPEKLKAVVGQTLADVKLPKGFTWMENENTLLEAEGEMKFKVMYTPENTKNYLVVKDIEAVIKVEQSEQSEQQEQSGQPEQSGQLGSANPGKSPKTGDVSNVSLYAVLIAGSFGAGATVVTGLHRNRRKNKK